jgi:hypothetical protein
MNLLKRSNLACLLAMSLLLASCSKSNSNPDSNSDSEPTSPIQVNTKAKQVNLAGWASLATEIFKGINSLLPDIGGAFTASEKKATISALELGLHNAGAPAVAKGTLAFKTFYEFDNGAGTLLFQLTIRGVVYAVQIYRVPGGTPTVYVGRTNPTVLVAAPPASPVDCNRLGEVLELELNGDHLTLGPVNQLAIGTTLANDLIAQGFPTTASSIHFSEGVTYTGSGGDSVSLLGTLVPNDVESVAQDFDIAILLNSDGTFTVSTILQSQGYLNLYPVSNPVSIFSGVPTSSPFYYP